MRQLKFLALLIVAGFILSCKKYSGPTTAQGQVVDETTGKGIPNAEVWLMRDKGSSAMARTHMETQNTDENGNFSFTIETESDYSYFLDASAEHYYTDAEGGYITAGEKNENMKVKIKPKGYIKFIVTNDSFKVRREVSIFGHFNSDIHISSNDTIVFRDVLGNNKIPIVICFRDSGLASYQHTSVYVPALDTVEYTIKY
ncbi:MAG: hypothetical protein ACXWD4_00705 [Bacteroidia bacterium]